jgi:hypothetical protein
MWKDEIKKGNAGEDRFWLLEGTAASMGPVGSYSITSLAHA